MADTVDIFYDGLTYYATIEDTNSIFDTIEVKVWVSEHQARSEAVLSDAVNFDTIINIVEDPGFLTLLTPAKKIKDINNVRNFDVDENGNIIALSTKFIFKISPTGELLSKKFTVPNLSDHIIDVKWFNNYLWVLHIETIPEDSYEIFNELIGLGEIADIGGQQAGGYNFPYRFLNSPPQWERQVISAYNVFRISKYDADTGEVISSFDLQMIAGKDFSYEGQYLLSPTSMDIRGNSIVISDQGDASFKSYTLEGLYTGRYSDEANIVQPTQIVIEDDRYLWFVDTERITYLPEKYRLRRLDTTFGIFTDDIGYAQFPYMDMRAVVGSFEKHVVNRVGENYEYYLNFVENSDISEILYGHATELIRMSVANYLYLLNSNPFEIRIINLDTLDTQNVRECYEPVTITDHLIEETPPYPDPYADPYAEPYLAETVVTDTGLQEVSLYNFYGQKGNVIVDNLIPKGITKHGSVYYITDLRHAIIYKVLPNEVQTITNIPFARPTDITNDGVNLFTLDTGNNKIYKTDFAGNIEKVIGATGDGEVEFNYPEGITIDNEDIYVLDSGNFRVQVLNKEGDYQREFPLSEASDVIYIPQSTTINLIGDQDDVWEKANGQATVFGDNYINYANGYLLAAYQFTLDLEDVRIRDAKLRLLKKNEAARYDINVTLENTSNAQPYRSTAVNRADIVNRIVYDDKAIRWQGDVGLGTLWMETVNFADILQLILDKLDWIPGNKISIVLRSQLSQTDDLILTASVGELILEYDLIKRTRPKGLFHAIAVDEDSFYVADISQYKLNSYDKITGVLKEDYNLGSGTVLTPSTEKLFITDEGCRISAVNTYQWTVVESYSLELSSNPVILHYNFEPVWESELTEQFERVYTTVLAEDFEWYDLTGWVLSDEEEFELLEPFIEWIL